jgi:hypothetical protein
LRMCFQGCLATRSNIGIFTTGELGMSLESVLFHVDKTAGRACAFEDPAHRVMERAPFRGGWLAVAASI